MYKFTLPKIESIKINQALSKRGGIIAFPTDTVWGLGCVVENYIAAEKIYSIKGRPANKPLILLGSQIDYLVPYVSNINKTAGKIINKYLPGAVTVILPKSDLTPDYITSGFDTVGIRVPDYPPFVSLLDNAVKNHVLATTSANISGQKTSISKKEVSESIGSYVDYIYDDYGYKSKELESTVVLVTNDENFKILRQGAVIIDI